MMLAAVAVMADCEEVSGRIVHAVDKQNKEKIIYLRSNTFRMYIEL